MEEVAPNSELKCDVSAPWEALKLDGLASWLDGLQGTSYNSQLSKCQILSLHFFWLVVFFIASPASWVMPYSY